MDESLLVDPISGLRKQINIGTEMRCIPIFAIIFLATSSAIAQSVPMGCYTKDYSDDHLARNPEQVVDQISILFIHRGGTITAAVRVLLADQGHAGRDGYGGMEVSEFAVSAGDYNVSRRFNVDCDGGGFDVIESDSESLVIETSRFRLSGNNCINELSGSSLVEDGSSSTRYKLERPGEMTCDWFLSN